MWTRCTVAATAIGLLLAGCGHQASPRAKVARYLKNVDAVERALAQPLGRVTTVGGQFAREQRAGGSLTSLVYASNAQTLRNAYSQITVLRAKLAALDAPPPARRLRTLLLQIVDGQAQLTHEVGQLVVFLPAYSATLKPLAPATRRLEAALSQTTALGSSAVTAVYDTKSSALLRFQAVVKGVLNRLGRLDPPAVSKPDYRAQISALRRLSVTAGQLSAALRGGLHGNVQQLLTRFDRAATSTTSIATQRAQIAAVKAYDQEIARLARLTQDAEQERLRLANNLA
jgi:hypothetical protein